MTLAWHFLKGDEWPVMRDGQQLSLNKWLTREGNIEMSRNGLHSWPQSITDAITQERNQA